MALISAAEQTTPSMPHLWERRAGRGPVRCGRAAAAGGAARTGGERAREAASALFGELGEPDDLLSHGRRLPDRHQVRVVQARQHCHRQHRRPRHSQPLRLLCRRRRRGAHHLWTATGVDVEQRGAEADRRAHRAGDRVRNVVELEVEEERRGARRLDDGADAGGAVGAEELEAELHAEPGHLERADHARGRLKVGRVDSDEHGRSHCPSLGRESGRQMRRKKWVSFFTTRARNRTETVTQHGPPAGRQAAFLFGHFRSFRLSE